jgi:hypothetical protein
MGLFSRSEPIHKRLGRALMSAEAGGFLAEPPDVMGKPTYLGEPAFHGVARPRRWDVFTTVEAPEVDGTEVDFAVLPDGTVIVDEEARDANLGAFADAVEERLPRPYRAHGVRQTESLWAVSARRIEVARFEARGNRIELTQTSDGKTFVVDGERSFGTVRDLEELGEGVADEYAIEAERLDADLWEVRVSPL